MSNSILDVSSFWFLAAVRCLRRTNWPVWTYWVFPDWEGERLGDFEAFGFFFVFLLFVLGTGVCGGWVCVFAFKLLRNTTYSENLTAQGTFLELWHYFSMELIWYPWCVAEVSFISGADNSMPHFKRDFHLFSHNFFHSFPENTRFCQMCRKNSPFHWLFISHTFPSCLGIQCIFISKEALTFERAKGVCK